VVYLYANFILPRPLCSRVRPDVRDRQTDVRQKHRLISSPIRGGGIMKTNNKIRSIDDLYVIRPDSLIDFGAIYPR